MNEEALPEETDSAAEVPAGPPTGLVTFGFRPWVRSTCRTAMIWGVGVLFLFGGVAWYMRAPDDGFFGRAFAVLAAYTLLFQVSLMKIWWTAGAPAMLLDDATLGYQPLHTFRPKRIPFSRVLATSPRLGTQSLRVIVEGKRRDRELFLNLAVVQGRHHLTDELGRRLQRIGLEPFGTDGLSWRRPGFEEPNLL